MKEKKDYKELFRAIKFTLISISAGIIQIGTFTLMYEVFKWIYCICYVLLIGGIILIVSSSVVFC